MAEQDAIENYDTKKRVWLRDEVTCTLTGFKGTITSVAFYMYGCIRCIVTSKKIDPEKGPIEFWFDEPQLKITKKARVAKTKSEHGPRGYKV